MNEIKNNKYCLKCNKLNKCKYNKYFIKKCIEKKKMYYNIENIETNNYYKNMNIKKEILKDLKLLRIDYKLLKYYNNKIEKIKKENENYYFNDYSKYYIKIRKIENENINFLKIITKYNLNYIKIKYDRINFLINYKYSLYLIENIIKLLNEKLNYLENL